jgi:hypothetical protein
MYSTFSLASPTPMTATRSVVSSQSQRFTFIDQTGQPSSVESSQTQRRIVRSHAMVDVRRRQMLQLGRNFRLRWTDPKVKVEVDEGVCESCSPVAYDYDFVDQSFEAKEGTWERDEDPRRKAPNRLTTSRRSEQRVKGSKRQSPPSMHRTGRNLLPGIDQITRLASDEDPKLATTRKQREQRPSSTARPTTPLDILATSSPRSILGAGRVNPFENFPVEADQDLYELIDHCTKLLPSIRKMCPFSTSTDRSYHVRHRNHSPPNLRHPMQKPGPEIFLLPRHQGRSGFPHNACFCRKTSRFSSQHQAIKPDIAPYDQGREGSQRATSEGHLSS